MGRLESQGTPLPFDKSQYAEALSYFGQPTVVGARPLVLRSIPGVAEVDAFGPFPYGSPPTDPEGFRRALAEVGAVTWTGVIRPGADATLLATFDPLTTKEHFVHLRTGPALQPSPRTRRHIRRGAEIWSVELRSMAEAIDTATRLHRLLECRAPLSRVARVDRRHFEIVATIDGFRCVVATAQGREVGAFLVFAEAGDEIHFHLTAGDERALRDDGMYAIFDFMIRTYGATHDLYLGGTPAGANGEGVGRFKARFANGRRSTYLARAVLDARRCEQLVALFGEHRWFPPYRDPNEDQGIALGAAAKSESDREQ